MKTVQQITYLRAGRTLRASGSIIETDSRTGMFKVKPVRDEWRAIWLTVHEIQAGGDRAPANPTPNPIPAVGQMVDGLRILLSRKKGGGNAQT